MYSLDPPPLFSLSSHLHPHTLTNISPVVSSLFLFPLSPSPPPLSSPSLLSLYLSISLSLFSLFSLKFIFLILSYQFLSFTFPSFLLRYKMELGSFIILLYLFHVLYSQLQGGGGGGGGGGTPESGLGEK